MAFSITIIDNQKLRIFINKKQLKKVYLFNIKKAITDIKACEINHLKWNKKIKPSPLGNKKPTKCRSIKFCTKTNKPITDTF